MTTRNRLLPAAQRIQTINDELARAQWDSDPFAAADADGESTWPYALGAVVVTLAAALAALGCGGAL